MAREMDSQGEWQRLVERYRAMSDGELLQLAAAIGDLTETAGDALRSQMRGRGLEIAAPESAGPAHAFKAVENAGTRKAPNGGALNTFYDAFDAGRACDCLEDEGVVFELRDVSAPSSGLGTFDGRPPVVLQLFVESADRERAMEILRKKMGLFPLQEVEVADESVDDGTVTTLGGFGHREDAEEVARILEEAGVWHRVVANPEGTEENEDRYTLEVREIDLMRAGEVVEAGLELPEE
jgi:hypothetical protein